MKKDVADQDQTAESIADLRFAVENGSAGQEVLDGMGIAYTVMLCFVLNYALYTGGGNLPGTFPLFLIPVSVALAAILIHRMKQRTCPGGVAGGIFGLVLCAVGAALGLLLGFPALLGAFIR